MRGGQEARIDSRKHWGGGGGGLGRSRGNCKRALQDLRAKEASQPQADPCLPCTGPTGRFILTASNQGSFLELVALKEAL